MQKKTVGDKTLFSSKVCKGCYSTQILNIYKSLANKILCLPVQDETNLIHFESSCKLLHEKFPEIKKLRFYSLSDFSPEDLPYILAAHKYFTVDIISKKLTLPQNEFHLKTLFDMPNVWVSLSFNHDFKKHLPRIQTILDEAQPRNVQMNFTASLDDDLDQPFYRVFNVIHLKNIKKRRAIEKFKTVPQQRLCAVYDRDGNSVMSHGSCDKCPNCHLSYSNLMKGKLPFVPMQ